MLADQARNDAFQQAIEKAVTPESIVLDIGTGSGLLAMMAARAGAKHVYACEMNKDLAEVAKKVVATNGYADRVTIFHKKSTDLNVGEELPEKADILVSEILDAGLLGEEVLPTFRHAREHLLTPGAKIIPHSAQIYGTLIESAYQKRLNPIRTISGFDLSPFNIFTGTQDYVRVDLKSLPHRVLSETFPIHTISFVDLPRDRSGQNSLRIPIEAKIIESGSIHGLAFWFDLWVDEDIKLSTAMNGEMIHWGQALHMFEEERRTSPGKRVKVNAHITDKYLQFSL